MGDLARYSCSGGSSRSRPNSVMSGSRTRGVSPQKRTSSGAPRPKMWATTMPSMRPEGVDADLNTPASTPSGRIDGMVVAHILGRGAPELVRFWGETPLVREPDITLFGLERLDPPEQEYLAKSPMRHYRAGDIQFKGAAPAAQEALSHMHAEAHDYVLHLDIDAIAQEDFPAVNVPGNGGLRFDDVRVALTEFAKHKNLLGLDVAQYNPDKDPDGSGAKKLVDLLAEALAARLQAFDTPAPEPAPSASGPAGPTEVSSSGLPPHGGSAGSAP